MLASGGKFLHRVVSEVKAMDEKNHSHTYHYYHDRSPHSPADQEGKTHKDPVCGMTVKKTTPHAYKHEGQRYFFCGARCLEKFRTEPDKYLKPSQDHAVLDFPAHATQPQPAGEGAGYTCPMHPEVRQPGPGTCPACGMALKPLISVAPVTRTEYICPMQD